MAITKKIQLNLVGLDGNAFSLLGAFASQARKEHWSKEEIEEVHREAMRGNYDHLISTLSKHCEYEEDWEDDFEDEENCEDE